MNEEVSHNPTFIISLDTELLWGVIHTDADYSRLTRDTSAGRGVIDTLLSLFKLYNIPATWAIVGHLFLDRCKKEEGIPHRNMPRFKEDWYSSDPCTDIHKAPLYYGKDIVEKILSSLVKHEIGYHSFSHVIFSECSREVAQAEIEEGVKLAKEMGISLKSFVFPQDKVGHLDVLKENGFVAYRGIRAKHIGSDRNLLLRKFGGAVDKLIALPVEPKWKDGIWEIPASMIFLDPLFPFSLVDRAKRGISRAIKEDKVFHMYLHPENLLYQPSLGKYLDELLAFVARKRDEGKLHAATMGELASYLNSRRS